MPKSSPAVSKILTGSYIPGIAKALSLIPSETSPGENGYVAEVTRHLNTNLEGTGLSVSSQAVSDFLSGRKIGDGGLGLSRLMAIALGIPLSKDSSQALALLSLILAGAWDPDELSPSAMEQSLKNASSHGDRSGNYDSKINEILDSVRRIERKVTGSHPVTNALQEILKRADFPLENVGSAVGNVFSKESAGRIEKIFQGMLLPEPEDLLAIAMFLSQVTDRKWTVTDLQDLATGLASARLETETTS